MANGALIAATDFANVDASGFSGWYRHIPERPQIQAFAPFSGGSTSSCFEALATARSIWRAPPGYHRTPAECRDAVGCQ
jgi:hypothetical protein